MLTGKFRRDWLFRRSRPVVRPFASSDRGFLWAAHLAGVFGFQKDITQEQFLIEVAKMFGAYPHVWVIEDDCDRFRAGKGPIVLVGIKSDGWTVEPFPMFFPWARKRHILRACVGFLHMIRYRKEVGCCVVKGLREQCKMLDHMKKYGVLYPRGMIPMGCDAGDLFVYSITGRRQSQAQAVRIAA